MNRKTIMLLAGLLIMSVALASVVSANNGNDGPSDSYGDGVSDGSEFEPQNGPNGENGSGVGYGEPAPSSGDGESEGPER